MASEIEIETEKSKKKLKKKTQEVIMWFLFCSHSVILISKLWKKEVGLDSRVCINSKENENKMSFHSNIIIFWGIFKGVGPFTRVPGF